jgi:hypothetical protein
MYLGRIFALGLLKIMNKDWHCLPLKRDYLLNSSGSMSKCLISVYFLFFVYFLHSSGDFGSGLFSNL